MNKIIITLALLFTSASFASGSNSSLPSSERFELCYLGDRVMLVQPNMCYALGGIRG